MPEYALVEDGEVVSIGPEPDSWENEDGSTTSTPVDTPSDPKVLAAIGYLPIEDKSVKTPEGHVQDGWDLKVQKSKVVRTPRFVESETPARSLDDDAMAMIQEMREAQTDLDSRLSALEGTVGALTDDVNESEMPSFREAVRDLQTAVRELRRG